MKEQFVKVATNGITVVIAILAVVSTFSQPLNLVLNMYSTTRKRGQDLLYSTKVQVVVIIKDSDCTSVYPSTYMSATNE